MNTQLLTFLKENHSIDGTIKVDDSSDMLDETARQIIKYQSADIDILTNNLFSFSDLNWKLSKSLVERDRINTVSLLLELEILSESYLIELIELSLRAEL